jgi:phosphoribosylformylglycinamidine synthase
MTLDGNGRYCYLDPREGAKLAVAEAARNLTCVGAEPLAITNCLNFASPERPEVMWSFSETIDGIAEACQAFETPVTGGNVSFYNETEGQGVYSTPVIGMIGVIDAPDGLSTPWFKQAGDLVVLLGETAVDIGGSEFLAEIMKQVVGPVPRLDLDRERAVQRVCWQAIRSGIIKSAHDCSDGGLGVALAECCYSGPGRESVGVEINAMLNFPGVDESWLPIIFLFSESPSRIIVSLSPSDLDALSAMAKVYNVPLTALGTVGGRHFRVSLNRKVVVDTPVRELEQAWRGALAAAIER